MKTPTFVADSEAKAERAGVMVGSGIGGMIELYDFFRHFARKGRAAHVALYGAGDYYQYGVWPYLYPQQSQRPNHACVTACATGAHAVGDAARMIALGDADLMVAGSTDRRSAGWGWRLCAAARALSSGYNDQPEQASRPWDKGRDGFVMGDGAGMLILESLEHARHAAPASTLKSSAMVCPLTHTT